MDPIVFEENPSRADVDALKDAVDAFNYAATGHRDGRWLTAFVRDDTGAMIAGISGFTWGGYAKVEYLWVAEAHRRRGIGKRLLAAAEGEARTRGCAQIILDTHDFQAPRFYAKQGYVPAGRIEGAPSGSAQTWFRKAL